MKNFYFISYNILILLLNLLFIIFLVIGFCLYDTDISKVKIATKNIIFLVFYALVYSLKLAFLPIILYCNKKNRFLKYLKLKIIRSKKYWITLLFKAFLFDYLTLLIFSLFIPNNNILMTFIGPIIIMPFSYYFGGGVFLSYLGLVIWFKVFKKS